MLVSYLMERKSSTLMLMNSCRKEMNKKCKLNYCSMFHLDMCTSLILQSWKHPCKLYKLQQRYTLSKVQGIWCKFHYYCSTLCCTHMKVLFYQHQNMRYNLLQFQNKQSKVINTEDNSIQKRCILNYKYIGLYSCQPLYRFNSQSLMYKLHKLSGNYCTHYY